jgi:hypothetical protein
MWIVTAEGGRRNILRGKEGQQGENPAHESILHNYIREKDR